MDSMVDRSARPVEMVKSPLCGALLIIFAPCHLNIRHCERLLNFFLVNLYKLSPKFTPSVSEKTM